MDCGKAECGQAADALADASSKDQRARPVRFFFVRVRPFLVARAAVPLTKFEARCSRPPFCWASINSVARRFTYASGTRKKVARSRAVGYRELIIAFLSFASAIHSSKPGAYGTAPSREVE